jgi:hypothetical protein
VKRAYAILFLGLAAFFCLQLAIFHTRAYAYWVSPSSSTGYVETVLYNESIRPKNGPNQIVGIGDSRFPLVTKVANEHTAQTGYQYGTVAVAGATPRAWYYILRAADPNANKYKAVVIGVESYNDDETFEDLSDRESDLNYMAARLQWSDLPEFSFSYKIPQRQWRAASGILFRGLVYKRDALDFLADPRKRVHEVRQSWRDSHAWYYDFRTDEKTLDGLTVDWEHKTMTPPTGATPEFAQVLKNRFLDPLPVDKGVRSAYMKHWLGRIYEHYKGSQTRLVFFRLPRAAWIRPDLPPTNPNSSVHRLEKYSNVRLLPEHLLDELETPATFHDEVHMNQIGLDRFTEILVREMPKVLTR